MKSSHQPKIAFTATKVPSVYGVYTILKASLHLFGFNIQLQKALRW